MADTSQITCPNCGQSYAVRPEQWAQYQGRTINCTKCSKPFTVTAPGMAQPQAVATTPATGGGRPPQSGGYQPPPSPQSSVPPAQGGYLGAPGAAVPYGGYAQGAVATTGTSGWAITSLITGIVSFCVPIIGSIAAIVTGIVGIVRTKDPRMGGRGFAIAGLVLGCISMVGGLVLVPAEMYVLLPSLNRARAQAQRTKCAVNMRRLGQAMVLYASANGNAFPDKLEDLLKSDPTLSGSDFVCPSDNKTPATGNSTQIAAGIANGQHTSYIYVGSGLTTAAPVDAVLLYEPLTDHANEGMNVLLADGHVEWLSQIKAKGILNQQAAGTKPIRLP